MNRMYLSKSVEGCKARVELRDCVLSLLDGLSGISQIGATGASGAASLTITGSVLNTTVTDQVPLGARFTVVGEAGSPIHTVTARVPTGLVGATGPTTQVTFSPVLATTLSPASTGVVGATGTLAFQSQKLDIKIGDGNITYTEHRDYQYVLDRGDLDTVREKDQVPMDVKLDCVYEHITQGTTEPVSPMDALKRTGGAAEWVSSATDKCEPYAVDLQVVQTPPCGGIQVETTLFPDLRAESREMNLKDATIAVTAKCNAIEPIVTRS